jgi:GTPase SAR1 family protein
MSESGKKIMVWGLPRSGKTMLVYAIYRQFQTEGDYRIILDEPTHKRIDKQMRDVINSRASFLDKTDRLEAYTIKLKSSDEAVSHEIVLRDAPGEHFRELYELTVRDVESVGSHGRADNDGDANGFTTVSDISATLQQLRESDGIMVLLDPAYFDERLRDTDQIKGYMEYIYDLLRDKLNSKGDNARLKDIKIALCLVKADVDDKYWNKRLPAEDECGRLSKENNSSCHECPIYEHLRERMKLELTIKDRFEPRQIRCFILSAIGRTRDEQLNVGTNNPWKRNITPAPKSKKRQNNAPESENNNGSMPAPATDDGEVGGSGYPEAMYYPQTIIDPAQIRPKGTIDPILWLLGIEDNTTG